MQLTYTLTLTDIKAALHLHIKQDGNRRIRYFITNAIIPALAIFGTTVYILLTIIGQKEWASRFHIVGIVLIFLSFWFYFYRSDYARRAYKRLFPPTRTDRTSNTDISDQRILSRTPGVSEETYFWTAITAFAQDDKMTLLYLDGNRFLLFPTRALSPDQRTELNDLVARNMPRKLK
jgi:hypothetical protein